MRNNSLNLLRVLIVLIIYTFPLCMEVHAQKINEWEESPTLSDTIIPGQSEFVFFDTRLLEYEVNGDVELFYSRHYKTKVFNDIGIEQNNTFYLNMSSIIDIVELKVRTIKPDGSIVDFDKSDIKKTVDSDNGQEFSQFAISGLEPNAEIEVYFKLKKIASLYGHNYFGANYPQENLSFTLSHPSHIIFESKAYNFPFEVSHDTIEDKEMVSVSYTIPHLNEYTQEKFANNYANQPRIEYKFSHNSSTNSAPAYTWANFTKDFFNFFYESVEKKEIKAINKYIKKHKLTYNKSEKDLINIINQMKDDFILQKVDAPQIMHINNIIRNKYSNDAGLTRLYCQVFDVLNIKHHLLIGSNRTDKSLDRDFPSWHYINEYLIYFPEYDTYLSPSQLGYRYNLIPSPLQGRDALRVKLLKVGELKSAVYDFHRVRTEKAIDNFHNIYTDVVFKNTPEEYIIEAKQTYGGENAIFLKPYYNLFPEEEKEKLINEIVEGLGSDMEIKETVIENSENNLSVTEHPFTIKAKYTQESFIESVGDKYILNIGKLIGEQSELYDEKEHERVQDIDIVFTHSLNREIKIKAPEGYVFDGLDNLDFDFTGKNKDGEEDLAFVSNYTLENGELIISIRETYNELEYPVERYNEFREIINAAANFNKVSIMLIPQ